MRHAGLTQTCRTVRGALVQDSGLVDYLLKGYSPLLFLFTARHFVARNLLSLSVKEHLLDFGSSYVAICRDVPSSLVVGLDFEIICEEFGSVRLA
jgi:hypothetical protein